MILKVEASSKDLQEQVIASLGERRPLLHHLNADTSWLLQIPRPAVASRRWFNVLFDPWLSGSQSDVASWFSSQTHKFVPAIGSIAALEKLCAQVESLSGQAPTAASSPSSSPQPPPPSPDTQSHIDVIIVSHEFTDHCHKRTLLECRPQVPVFAAHKAANLIKSWHHFDTVITTPAFTKGSDWRAVSMAPLPPWLSITRLTTQANALYYHSAVLVAFSAALSPSPSSSPTSSSRSDGEEKEERQNEAEAVIYTPHGIHAPSLAAVAEARPRIATLAFLHGLHDVSISLAQQLNLGAHNGLAAQRLLGAKYWIATHDEEKKGSGVVSWFLRRKTYTVEDALRREAKKGAAAAEEEEEEGDETGGGGGGGGVLGRGKRFLDVGNGECAVLA